MKLEVEDDTFFAIRDTHISSMVNPWFWGKSPYGGTVECNGIQAAYRFDTAKEAKVEIRRYAEQNGMPIKDVRAKVVRVRMRTTATIYQ